MSRLAYHCPSKTARINSFSAYNLKADIRYFYSLLTFRASLSRALQKSERRYSSVYLDVDVLGVCEVFFMCIRDV